jgi:DNA-binding MarR family transcriptional regulator
MTFKKLGEKTLITKGTLTGVIGRLEDKGLVQRVASETDGRSQIVKLTAAGEDVYQRSFPEHLSFINRIFDDYSPEDIVNLEDSLKRLHKTVTALRNNESGMPSDETDQ